MEVGRELTPRFELHNDIAIMSRLRGVVTSILK
jgi:hypothetical protein